MLLLNLRYSDFLVFSRIRQCRAFFSRKVSVLVVLEDVCKHTLLRTDVGTLFEVPISWKKFIFISKQISNRLKMVILST